MIDVIYLPLIASIPLGVLLGCFGMVSSWDKNTFFSHALSHSMLLPPSIGVLIGITSIGYISIGNILFSILFSILFTLISQIRPNENKQNALMVVSFACLAGALIISFHFQKNIDMSLLVSGDMLLMDEIDVVVLYLFSFVSVGFLILNWKTIVLYVLNPELAILRHKHANRIANLALVLQGVFVAIAVKIVGILLISAINIMPAIIARIFSKHPVESIILSCLISVLVMVAGVLIAFAINLPIVPTIIVLYVVILPISMLAKLTLISKYK